MPKTNTDDVLPPDKFRHLRAEMGITQQAMADLLGYQQRAQVRKLEDGTVPIRGPLLQLVRRIAAEHKIDLS